MYGFGTPEYYDEPLYEDDEVISDAYSAVWRALTVYGLSNLVEGQHITVYGQTFEILYIQPYQIIVKDPKNITMGIPNSPWSSFAQ